MCVLVGRGLTLWEVLLVFWTSWQGAGIREVSREPALVSDLCRAGFGWMLAARGSFEVPSRPDIVNLHALNWACDELPGPATLIWSRHNEKADRRSGRRASRSAVGGVVERQEDLSYHNPMCTNHSWPMTLFTDGSERQALPTIPNASTA